MTSPHRGDAGRPHRAPIDGRPAPEPPLSDRAEGPAGPAPAASGQPWPAGGVRLVAAATAAAPALLLRPWRAADAEELAGLYRDGLLRRWTNAVVEDPAGAARWIEDQRRAWEDGERYAFAVLEDHRAREGGRLAGHVVLKRSGSAPTRAEVGYWTAAHARGRGVAPRALAALTAWAFAGPTGPGGPGLLRLELLHQVDNTASCRVARKCGYALAATLPAAPPEFPGEGHRHVRTRIRTADPRSA
ncbi:GNAT family N-acetyltransferase [Streptomyces tropicalis]|uniref:GNAT family N-acetyltransferase n=1 Tax=Streptomyces tropicalis TaxID=3034234 RepID=A0ABT6A9M8_9ACTN|nr:GNAT family N-acetyltransferase [Streptomyces tropicalis]MDF3301351.1 GNAT family N-acetyltransferase [Streptomyces tropicalis]